MNLDFRFHSGRVPNDNVAIIGRGGKNISDNRIEFDHVDLVAMS